jgi:hypothetical protein
LKVNPIHNPRLRERILRHGDGFLHLSIRMSQPDLLVPLVSFLREFKRLQAVTKRLQTNHQSLHLTLCCSTCDENKNNEFSFLKF